MLTAPDGAEPQELAVKPENSHISLKVHWPVLSAC